MKTVDIGEAELNLAHLVEAAARGEPFVIARAGKPLVKVEALEGAAPEAPARPVQRIGFMAGQFRVPADFDTMDQAEIERLFHGDE